MNKSIKKESKHAFVSMGQKYGIPSKLINEHLTYTKDGRIDVASIKGTIDFLIKTTEEKNIPLFIGEHQKIESLGSLGRYITHAPTFKQALYIIEAYHQIIHTGIRPVFTFKRDFFTLELHYDFKEVANIRYPAEAFFSTYVKIFSEILSHSLKPQYVKFYHPLQSDIKAFHRIFGKKVTFNNDKNIICFSNDFLACSLRDDSAVLSIYKQHADVELLNVEDNLITYIKEYIKSHLIGEVPTLKMLSQHLKLPERTIQHRLASKQLGFKFLLSSLRFEKALRLIKDGEPLEMISFLVGFQNSSAFYKAFKKYFNVSPSEYKSKYLYRR